MESLIPVVHELYRMVETFMNKQSVIKHRHGNWN